MIGVTILILLLLAVYYGRKELKFRRMLFALRGVRYAELSKEERQQNREEFNLALKDHKLQANEDYHRQIAAIKNPNLRRVTDPPPRKFLHGVGGSTNLPNPAYVTWHIEKYGREPDLRRDDSYDGFLE